MLMRAKQDVHLDPAHPRSELEIWKVDEWLPSFVPQFRFWIDPLNEIELFSRAH